MKILVVHYSQLNAFPPVISLIQNLINNNHKVTLISEGINSLSKNIIKNKNFKGIEINSSYKNGIFQRIYHLIKRKRKLKYLIKREMRQNDLIWTTTAITAREIGKELFKYKHIMQLMELVEDIPLFSKQLIFKAHLYKIAQKAYKVVVPDENRAYIQKTWWNLSNKPTVLPNKPYLSDNKFTEIPEEIIRKIKEDKRTIILYQGVFKGDRNLDEFAKAIQKLGNEKYGFYIMGQDSEMRKNLCKKYPFINYLGFIAPPNHLKITKMAHIGILPYIPDKTAPYFWSELNALFCAPNKIYEYALCGLPMIGTDVPGLKYPFEKYNIGVCCKQLKKEDIITAIKYIESNYESMCENCKTFYNSIDLDKIVKEIIT